MPATLQKGIIPDEIHHVHETLGRSRYRSIMDALKSVDVEGADLCVRPGYPVNPENAEKQLPAAAKQFADEGLSIPLVTTPTSFLNPEDPDVQRVYAACGDAGVANLKVGYWHWSKEDGGYWALVDRIRAALDGSKPSPQNTASAPACTTIRVLRWD